MRPELHRWTSTNTGRRRHVRPSVLAAARKTFRRILLAIAVAGACGVIGRHIPASTVSTGPYASGQGQQETLGTLR